MAVEFKYQQSYPRMKDSPIERHTSNNDRTYGKTEILSGSPAIMTHLTLTI